MEFKIDFAREDDGRWIAEIVELPGVMVYGSTKEEADYRVKALALRVMADRAEHDHSAPDRYQFDEVLA